MKRKAVKKQNSIRYLFYFILIGALVMFSVYLIQRASTDKIRQQEAGAAEINLRVATDPSFPEFLGQIVNGFPEDFPVYAGATLTGSAINNPPDMLDTGYRVRWELPAGVDTVEVMKWYKKELEASGWKFTDPYSWGTLTELVAQIERGNLKGYFAVEDEGDETELVANLNIQ